MKKTLFAFLFVLLTVIMGLSADAQERQSTTMKFDRGNLTFQYYEKDGVKIPDGKMEFSVNLYTEKGECKDGFMEGEWIIEEKTGNGKFVKRRRLNYERGLLEGESTFEECEINPSTKKEKPKSKQTYRFHKGHLYGENIITTASKDTLYCNYDEKGYPTGNWKYIGRIKKMEAEYENGKINPNSVFKIDVLGQKEKHPDHDFHTSVGIPLLLFGDLIKYRPYGIREVRPVLPTLCKTKYGYRIATEPIKE